VAESFELSVLLAITVVGGACWARAVMALRRGEIVLPETDRSAVARWGLLDVIGIAILVIVLTSLAMGLARGSVQGQEAAANDAPSNSTAGMYCMGAAHLIAVIVGFTWILKRYRYSPRDFGLGSGQWLRGVGAGAIGFVMWVPLVLVVQMALVQFFPYSHPTLERLQSSNKVAVWLALWFISVLVAPLLEEFFFRCVVQGWFQRLGQPKEFRSLASLVYGQSQPVASPQPAGRIYWPAIIATGVLFGLAHWSNGPAPVTLFLFSLGLGYLYQRTGSLPACVVMHMLLNFMTMAIATINQLWAVDSAP
jgi:membrane protease YdiL (CAAX protease family)